MEADIEVNGVLLLADLAQQSYVAEWCSPLELSGVAIWSPDGRELSLGGLNGIRQRAGLWIYDRTKKEAVKVLRGSFSGGVWSPDRSRLLVHLNQPYWETWVAALDPNRPTAESLRPVQTLAEHCQEAIETCNQDLQVDPESYVNRWTRTTAALWIGHSQALAYLQDLDSALDRRGAIPSDDHVHTLLILGHPALRQPLAPLAWVLARRAVEHQAGYAVDLIAAFERTGGRKQADQLRQLARANTPQGRCRYDKRSDTYIVVGGGADIWGPIDEFHFAYKRLGGDGSICARIESVDDVRHLAKTGVMIRESLDPGAAFAAVYVAPGNGVSYQARLIAHHYALSDDYLATPEQNALRAPVWLKIERNADQFSAFYSSDGVTWTPMAWSPQTISMPDSVYLGLALTSRDNRRTVEARISHVATTGAVSPSGPFIESQDIRLQVPLAPDAAPGRDPNGAGS